MLLRILDTYQFRNAAESETPKGRAFEVSLSLSFSFLLLFLMVPLPTPAAIKRKCTMAAQSWKLVVYNMKSKPSSLLHLSGSKLTQPDTVFVDGWLMRTPKQHKGSILSPSKTDRGEQKQYTCT